MKEVFEVGLDIIKKIQETQSEKLEQTGHLMVQAFIMQSKNTRDFSHEMNQIDRCQINNLKINDKYNALNIYICYNIDEGKTYGSC